MSVTPQIYIYLGDTGSTATISSYASPLDIWNPQIIEPHAGATWVIGQFYNVTWDTSNPPQRLDPTGQVLLSKGGIQYWQNPLATGFSLFDGFVTVQVPTDVLPGDDYAVVLFGDSGNFCMFTVLRKYVERRRRSFAFSGTHTRRASLARERPPPPSDEIATK